ncbi:RecQ family ATP-dependent DNA helicase [Stieleria sp. TO1_6]|uniref:RecQ family ATP-dependent DNA helicase n=1 Tax=Stieleria tagensis TaxID=2956795 RepID=UPI00209AE662|nr:RecQ family ATP-dependent DNA helicase [Stieleria tagensis]MCO8121082.1 RecQ family ATP-dependent DNA helicase [Stieleria tagensis]
MTAPHAEQESLLSRFGLNEFRPGQRDVIEAIANGEDVMCVMPTGGGKSLCYQLPSLAREGTTIVVSPLIALMKDQVDALQQLGIPAKLINSTLNLREQEDVMESMVRGELKLIYVAPERLRNGRFLETIERSNVSLLAVDEAHCVSEWGHDFRPDYARLGTVRQRYLGGLQTIALTATATPTVRDDICALLGLKQPRVFVTGFARTNLHFGVSHSKTDSEKETQLTEFVKKQPGAGIVYAATRKACESIGQWLPEKTRRPIGVYHGGMEPEHRRIVQEKFMSGDLAAIVATNAFGMGIDKSDIRFVAHYNMPGTLEAYYQEAGRAGRDGNESDCQLFFSYQDRYIQEFFIENRYPSREIVAKVYDYLLSRPEDPIELTLEQVRDAIKGDSAEAVGTAETLLAKAGVLRRLDSSQNQMLVRIDSDAPTMLDFLPREAKLRRRVMTAIERVIGRRRNDDVFVRPNRLMELADVEREQLMRTLRELSRLSAFDYVPPFRGRAVHVTQRDTPFDQLQIDFDELARRKAAEYEKLESVIGFARTGGCRQRVILDYFGDPESKNCDKCDRCVSQQDIAEDECLLTKGMTDGDAKSMLCGLRVILSGITRMHGRFGKNLVAQMLCGSQNKRISQWKLQRLSTYGMLSALKQSQLSKIIDAMIDHGMVEQREVDQRRPTIEISELGKAVMHLKAPIPGAFVLNKGLAKSLAAAARHIESTDVSTSDSAAVTAVTAPTDSPTDGDNGNQSVPDAATQPQQPSGDPGADSAWQNGQPDQAITVSLDNLTSPLQKLMDQVRDALKSWRRRTSAALGIPAYRVLSNSTIDRLAEIRPQTSSELESINGIGPATMEQHGYDILEVIRDSGHKHADGLATDPAGVEPQKSADETVLTDQTDAPAALAVDSPADPIGDPSHPQISERDAYWTWRLFSDGFAMDEVCQIRRLSRREIVGHLQAAADRGRTVSPSWQS